MGTALLRILDGETEWWLEWSTVVDAPVTYGMSAEELEAHIRHTQGTSGLRDLPSRMARARSRGDVGSSFVDYERDFEFNRAGAEETQLSIAQIIDHYCHRKPRAYGLTHCRDCGGEGCEKCDDGMVRHPRYGQHEGDETG